MNEERIIDAEWVDITDLYNKEQERKLEIKKEQFRNKVNHIGKIIMIVCSLGICLNIIQIIHNNIEINNLIKETQSNKSYIKNYLKEN